MVPKAERFEMRLDEALLDRIDAWRGKQDDIPSRAESIRRLVEVGLALTLGAPVKLDDGGKLTAILICEMLKRTKVDGDIDPDFVMQAIHGGHYWALKWEYPGIFNDHEDSETAVHEVVDTLDMWSAIESGHRKLSKKDKDRLEAEIKQSVLSTKFPGYDGNNEATHRSIARFLVEKMDRFTEFKSRQMNSHMRMRDYYARMYEVFRPMRMGMAGGELNATQIIEILKAG